MTPQTFLATPTVDRAHPSLLLLAFLAVLGTSCSDASPEEAHAMEASEQTREVQPAETAQPLELDAESPVTVETPKSGAEARATSPEPQEATTPTPVVDPKPATPDPAPISANPQTTTASEMPSWVEDPASFYDPPRPGVILAVGKARIRGSEQVTLMRAEMDGRQALMKARGSFKSDSETTTTADSVMTKVTIEGHLPAGGGRLAKWKSPDGWYYVLMN